MALDNRSIVITLKLTSDSEDTQEKKPTDTSSKKASNDKDSKGKALAVYAAMEIAETATAELVAWCEYSTNKDLNLVDDYIGQRNKSIAATQIGRAVSMGSSVVSSAVQGALLGGLPGAIVGAIVGLGTSISGIVRNNYTENEQQNIRIRQMNAQLDFTKSRAGWSLKAASIGEDL